MTRPTNRQPSVASSDPDNQLLVAHQAALDAWYERWTVAHRDHANDVLPIQRKAIERARELNPGHSPDVERVRNTNKGKPDQWRKT